MPNTTAKKSMSTAKKAASKTAGATKKTARTAAKAAPKAAKRAASTTTKKTTAKKTTAKKSTARKATVKKASSRRSTTRPTDAIALLKQEHREVEDLFEKFEASGKRAHKTRESIVGDIIEKLSVHAGIEEAVLYPAIRERITTAEDDVLEALEEHHVAKQTLAELQRMRSTDERFAAKVTVLAESVRHHVDEEEKGLFPEVRKEFTRVELEEMAERLTEAKSIAPSRPHPHAPDAPPANIAANIVTAPLDAAANVAENVVNKVRDIVS